MFIRFGSIQRDRCWFHTPWVANFFLRQLRRCLPKFNDFFEKCDFCIFFLNAHKSKNLWHVNPHNWHKLSFDSGTVIPTVQALTVIGGKNVSCHILLIIAQMIFKSYSVLTPNKFFFSFNLQSYRKLKSLHKM